MSVWVIVEYLDETDKRIMTDAMGIRGVYSSEEKAQAWIDRQDESDRFDIEKHEIDTDPEGGP